MNTTTSFKVGKNKKYAYLDTAIHRYGFMNYSSIYHPQYKIYTLNNKRN